MTDDDPPVIDAEPDYLTCDRCRVIRPADMTACPKCSLDAMLTVERFTPAPDADARRKAYARRRALERAINRR